jgi:hypothetical protein
MLLAVNLGSRRKRNWLMYNTFLQHECEQTHDLLVNPKHLCELAGTLQLNPTKSSARKHHCAGR